MKFKVKHNGKYVGTVAGNNMQEASHVASLRWGPGDYNITLISKRSDEEE